MNRNPRELAAPPSSPPLKVLLIGHGHLGRALLEGLLATPDCDVVGVFRWSKRHGCQGYREAAEIALGRRVEALGLPELSGAGVNSYAFMAQLEALQPQLLLIGSWGEILQPHVLQRPGLWVVNCHPSRLPAHRGANPYASAIRQGDTVTGVTFHWVEPTIDTGPILLQADVPIEPEDTGSHLRERCADTAQRLVPELIQRLKAGAPAHPQDEAQSSASPSLTLDDGHLDWNRAATQLHNQIRGLQPWLDCFVDITPWLRLTIQGATLDGDAPSPAPPGTVLGFRGGIQVATGQGILCLTRYRFRLGGVSLPEGLSRYLAPWFFPVGRCLGLKSLGG